MPRRKSSVKNDFDSASWKPWLQLSLFGGAYVVRVLFVSGPMSQLMSSISLFLVGSEVVSWDWSWGVLVLGRLGGRSWLSFLIW